jgi:hypothetical protein
MGGRAGLQGAADRSQHLLRSQEARILSLHDPVSKEQPAASRSSCHMVAGDQRSGVRAAELGRDWETLTQVRPPGYWAGSAAALRGVCHRAGSLDRRPKRPLGVVSTVMIDMSIQ